jgi:hypothetical protein
MWGGWGIYSPNLQNMVVGRLLSHGAPDRPVRHRPVDCLVRQLRVLYPLRAQARIKCVAVDRCARSSRCSAGTPYSPV